MFGLCKYKDILGVAGDTSKPRVLGVRIQDVIFLIVGLLIFCFFTKNGLLKTLAFTLILMVIFHRIFCVRSASDKLLFPDENDNFPSLRSGEALNMRFFIFVVISVIVIYYFHLVPTLHINTKFSISNLRL